MLTTTSKLENILYYDDLTDNIYNSEYLLDDDYKIRIYDEFGWQDKYVKKDEIVLVDLFEYNIDWWEKSFKNDIENTINDYINKGKFDLIEKSYLKDNNINLIETYHYMFRGNDFLKHYKNNDYWAFQEDSYYESFNIPSNIIAFSPPSEHFGVLCFKDNKIGCFYTTNKFKVFMLED